jgi:hypothetical protein
MKGEEEGGKEAMMCSASPDVDGEKERIGLGRQ